MKLASYTATRSGWVGICNRLIRWRFGGSFWQDGEASHCEIVFEPDDNVDEYMPDKTTLPDSDGAVWCASSAARDVIPDWAPRRVGKVGGVRLKRIVLDPAKWEIADYPRDPIFAIKWVKAHEGYPYDWSLIVGFVAWFVQMLVKRFFPETALWSACSSAVAAAGGYLNWEFFHPELLRILFRKQKRSEP